MGARVFGSQSPDVLCGRVDALRPQEAGLGTMIGTRQCMSMSNGDSILTCSRLLQEPGRVPVSLLLLMFSWLSCNKVTELSV